MKKSQRRIFDVVLSLSLVSVLFITGISAFLFDVDSKINKFTVGNVDITLREDKWFDKYGKVLSDENENKIPDFAERLLPGDKIDKAPYVENTGNKPAHIFIAVGIPVTSEENVYTGNGSSEKVINANPNDIIVTAYGIQENYAETNNSEKIWNTFLSNEGITKMFGERSDKQDNVELFELIGLDEENWTQLKVLNNYNDTEDNGTSSFYPSKNGYNYYFYMYKNKANNAILKVNNSTEPLFTNVKLTDDIGEEKNLSVINSYAFNN